MITTVGRADCRPPSGCSGSETDSEGYLEDDEDDEEVSDAEVARCIAIKEIGPKGQQGGLELRDGRLEISIEQPCESTLMQLILGMDFMPCHFERRPRGSEYYTREPLQTTDGKLGTSSCEESWAPIRGPRPFYGQFPTQMNKINTSCEIYSGPHDSRFAWKIRMSLSLNTQILVYQRSGEAITDRIAGMLPSYTVKNPKLGTHPVSSTLLAQALIYNAILDKYVESLELGKNRSTFVQGEIPAKIEDPELFTLPCRLGDSKPFDTLADLGSCVNIIPLYLFKKLNIRLLEETDHIFGLADKTKSYPVRIVKDVEVHIGKLKLLNDFYVIDMKKDPETPVLVGRGFLAIANAFIDCKMDKIAVGEGITRSVFGVKGVDLGEEEAPYWTTLGERESYKPRPSSYEVGAQTPYYARKDFLDYHLPEDGKSLETPSLTLLRTP
ncbi:MAK10-like protein [Tanacetum coccineum]